MKTQENEIKSKMQRLREEVSEMKGRDLEKKDIAGLLIEEEEPDHLWNAKKEQQVKAEAAKENKVPFREGHWYKTEQQKKENKMSSLNIDIQEKPLHSEEPEEKKQILEKLKENASQYKGIKKIEKPIQEEKLFEKGVSEKVIEEKISAGKILPERKAKLTATEEEELLKGFILDKPQKTIPEKPAKKTGLQFQEIEYEEPPIKKISVNPKKRMDNLQDLIPVNPDLIPKTAIEKEEENLTVGQQLGNVSKFFTKGLISKFGGKQIDKKILSELTKEEQKQVKKLASGLDVAVKKYTKEEITEAMQVEGKPKKIIDAVLKILYP